MRRIFISHSSKDNAAAAELKQRLEVRGHDALFLDFDPADGIPAGREWERELYQRIRACRAMIVLCSRDSMASRWCFMEMTHARALGKPLFAVKIDDCKLDGVLTDRQAVDLNKGKEEAYERLFRGLVVEGIDPAEAFPWDGKRAPYPGLLAFQEEDAAIFFGRGEEIAQGVEQLNRIHRLGDPRAVMVLAASGTGKSSLVRAGLVPRLRRAVDRWIVVDPFRPRSDPARELAAVLERAGARVAGDSLIDALLDLRRRSKHADAKVLLIIDQFEELLVAGDAHARFLTQLRGALEHEEAPAVLVATMRSDFLEALQSSKPLLDFHYDVLSLGPMSESDIREVIEEPAKEAELEIEPKLVEALVDDAGTPHALPLLAFTLRELWERSGNDRKLTLDDYRKELGGVQRVIGKAAEDVLIAARVTEQEEQALRSAFVSMMRITDDGRYARRIVSWDDLPESLHPLLERFVKARLLVSGAERTLEVAHERLFDSWERLHRWIDVNREALQLLQEIENAARYWREANEPPEYLWRGARVGRARELMSSGTLLLEDAERRFIEQSARAENIDRERAIEADIARARALYAQNFAEHERVLRQGGEHGSRETRALAPKYLEQAKRYEAEVKRQEELLRDWRREHGLEVIPDVFFTLEVLRASSGSAFLLHYGPTGAPRHILIDGGTVQTGRNVLAPRLRALRKLHPAGAPLPLQLVISTHTDSDHIHGLIELFGGLEHEPVCTIGNLWSNAFVPDDAMALARNYPKAKLVSVAKSLGIPINKPFTRHVAAAGAGSVRVRFDEGLSIRVLGPRIQWLWNFSFFWFREWLKREDDPRLLVASNAFEVEESFASDQLEIVPSPIEIVDPANDPGFDNSTVNLASMILMFELHGKRILLTSDSRSDLLLAMLAQAGYTDDEGKMDVDILALPHAGSVRNVSPEFFTRVRARHYIASADGKFGNPRPKTFEMLFDARRGDGLPFSIAFSNPPETFKEGYPLEELQALFEKARAEGIPFTIVTPAPGQGSFGIDLWREAAFVDKGAIA